MLPLGGIFIAIFVGWVMKKENVLEELDVRRELYFQILVLQYPLYLTSDGRLCFPVLLYLN